MIASNTHMIAFTADAGLPAPLPAPAPTIPPEVVPEWCAPLEIICELKNQEN